MKVTIICVGKLKEKYLKDALAEYSKRLGRYIKLDIIEVLDEKTPDNISYLQEKNIKKKEGERILKKLSANKERYIIALDLKGRDYSSEEFAGLLESSMTNGISHIYFIIGGSLGICDNVLKKCNNKVCFSKMTFPHQLVRIILVEQVYRGFKIIKKEPYHK